MGIIGIKDIKCDFYQFYIDTKDTKEIKFKFQSVIKIIRKQSGLCQVVSKMQELKAINAR